MCVGVIVLLHIPYLRLPYYWDEAGYYFPASLDMAHGHFTPVNTGVEPHPPLQFLYLAAFIKVFGAAPPVLRTAMCIVSGTALYALLLVAMMLIPAEAGLWAAGFLALSPLFFAQATMLHLDVAATAGTLFTLYFYLRGRIGGFLIAATALCLTRETGMFLVILLAVLARNPLMLLPILPLGGFFAFLRYVTGHWLGDPSFVQYNLWDALHPLRFLVTLLRRVGYLFFSDFRWVLSIPVLTALARSWRQPQGRAGYHLLWLVLASHLLVMSVFGGAILNRYLLPALAIFYLLSLEATERLKFRNRKWGLLFLLLVQIGCFYWNPPYPAAPEDNLAYVDFVNLQETAAEHLYQLPSGTRVLTAWPASSEFQRPDLGYVRPGTNIQIVELEDFSAASFENIKREDFDEVFIYSRGWRPEYSLFKEFPMLQRIQDNLYGGRQPVTPEWVRLKYRLGSAGSIHLRGQWVEWLRSYQIQRHLQLR